MYHSIPPDAMQPQHLPLPPTDLLILGAGRFGAIAAERLHRRYPEAAFQVVDADPEKLRRVEDAVGIPSHRADAVTFLEQSEIRDDIWIVPAVPVHVAYLWVLRRLARTERAQALPAPEALAAQVPNPFRGTQGSLYASYATFRCPDACSEPADICTHTGQPRLGNLFATLAGLAPAGFRMHVLRSHQLCPGVGGYPGRHLSDLFQQVAAQPGRHVIATSCRCHGVIDALEWSPR